MLVLRFLLRACLVLVTWRSGLPRLEMGLERLLPQLLLPLSQARALARLLGMLALVLAWRFRRYLRLPVRLWVLWASGCSCLA